MTQPTAGAAVAHRLGGPCIVFGDHVNTDVIIPGRYLVSIDPAELAEHAFEPLGAPVNQRLRQSKVVVAGRNFGCGSAREQAASCLVGAGVQAVVAASFARVFFRNAINTGLLAVESPEAAQAARDGEDVWVDYAQGTVQVGGATHRFPPYPDSIRHIIEQGGLIPALASQLSAERAEGRDAAAEREGAGHGADVR